MNYILKDCLLAQDSTFTYVSHLFNAIVAKNSGENRNFPLVVL